MLPASASHHSERSVYLVAQMHMFMILHLPGHGHILLVFHITCHKAIVDKTSVVISNEWTLLFEAQNEYKGLEISRNRDS